MPSIGEQQKNIRTAIENELAARVTAHQTNIAAQNNTQSRKLAFLALGDSWFDYPFSGNDPLGGPSDVIFQLLAKTGNPPAVQPLILKLAHYGDATTTELSLPKQQRIVKNLQDASNWLNNEKPDAILFSGGGDDIVGDQFCIYLDDNSSTATGLDPDRFEGALKSIKASYMDLFLLRDMFAKGVPIFGHCYDFAIPNGQGTFCAGPWLKPSLDFCGWHLPQSQAIVTAALTKFSAMLQELALVPQNNFKLIHTQGTLASGQWANELHPTPQGFGLIADKFLAALRAYAPFNGTI